MDNHPPEELKEQVLEFQSALIHNADRRRKTQISIYNPRHAKMLNNIWEAANVQDIPIPGAKKWRKLGFSASTSIIIIIIFHTRLILYIDSFSQKSPTESLAELAYSVWSVCIHLSCNTKISLPRYVVDSTCVKGGCLNIHTLLLRT